VERVEIDASALSGWLWDSDEEKLAKAQAAKLAWYKQNPDAIDAAVVTLVPMYATTWMNSVQKKPLYWPDQFAMWKELAKELAGQGGMKAALYEAAQWRLLQTTTILPPTPASEAVVKAFMEKNYSQKPGAWSQTSWADAQAKWREKEPSTLCQAFPFACETGKEWLAIGTEFLNTVVPYVGLAAGLYVGLKIFLPRRKT